MSEVNSYPSVINGSIVESVRDALERHSINPEEAIIVGGAVLGMYGIRQPHDVDAWILPSTFQKISEGTDPRGMDMFRAQGKNTLQTTWGLLSDGALGLEMMNPLMPPGMSTEEKDEAFNRMLISSRVLCTSGIYHQSLLGVLEAKRELVHKMRFPRFKDMWDIRRIKNYLSAAE